MSCMTEGARHDVCIRSCQREPAVRGVRGIVDARIGSVRLAVVLLVIGAGTACSGTAGTPASRTPGIESVAPPAATVSSGPEGSRFAGGVSEDGRYFVDQVGDPWFGMGDTAWSLIAQLGPQDVDTYLDERAARGLNLILANVLEHHYADNAPNNYNDDPPFMGRPFRSAPNEPYWRHVDYVVEAARVRGITVLLCPAYLGNLAEEGWSEELADATNEDMAEYGAFLRDRYGSFPNIMWLIGHDRVPDDTEKARSEALAAELPPEDLLGLGAIHDEVLGTPPWSPTTISPDFETVYTYEEAPVVDTGRAWAMRPPRPVMWLEGRYEQEDSAAPGDALLRRQEYGAVVAGASAVFFGNNPIWHFESVPLYEFEGTWQENLTSLGSSDAQRVGELVRGMPWSQMQPDTASDLLVDGDVAEDLAARSSDAYAFVYVPTARTVVLDLGQLTATDWVELRRFDPRSGESEHVGTYPTKGLVAVRPSGKNAAGDDDWVYMVSPAT